VRSRGLPHRRSHVFAAVPGHWKRYKDIAWLLVKYGRSDLVSGMRLEGFEAPTAEEMKATGAEDLAKDLERLAPTSGTPSRAGGRKGRPYN
jgi:hypothetical protein